MAMDEAAFAQLDRYIERRMAADNTPGLALALTDRERTLRVATYGFADLAARTPVTPDTLFEIGSIGKRSRAWRCCESTRPGTSTSRRRSRATCPGSRCGRRSRRSPSITS